MNDDEIKEAETVTELIQYLAKLNPNAPIHSTQPPFNGVKIVPQSDGKIMLS